MQLTIEPHVHSFLESPALTLDLLSRVPGLKLTLDYAHFTCLGWRQDEIDVLAPHAAHVHLRQAKPGALQTKTHQGTINIEAQLATLRAAGYGGRLSLEYVHQDYMETLYDDVLTETILLRDTGAGVARMTVRSDRPVAVVTGGAGGIGAAVVRRLAGDGHRVVVADREVAKGSALAAEVGGEAVALDITDPASVDEAVAGSAARLGRLDVLVNAAGIHLQKLAVDLEPEEWDRLQAVNARGPFLACRAAARPMMAQGSGRIVNITTKTRIREPLFVRLCRVEERAVGTHPVPRRGARGLWRHRQRGCAGACGTGHRHGAAFPRQGRKARPDLGGLRSSGAAHHSRWALVPAGGRRRRRRLCRLPRGVLPHGRDDQRHRRFQWLWHRAGPRGALHRRDAVTVSKDLRQGGLSGVTVEDILKPGFSTPWDAPMVPPFPFTFRNVEVLTLAWRTTEAAVARLLPPPLEPTSDVVLAHIYRMSDVDWLGAYGESNVSLGCRLPGTDVAGSYSPYLFLSSDVGVTRTGARCTASPRNSASPALSCGATSSSASSSETGSTC